MQSRGDTRVREGLLKALRSGPRDFLELRDALRLDVERLLGGREGHLHALVHGSLRRGELRLVGTSERGLARYALPAASEAESKAPTYAAVTDGEDARPARSMAGSVRDPTDRERIAADVAAHRRALRSAGAIQGFGSVRSARHMLRRVDKGKRTVLFSDGPGDVTKKILFHEGPWILTTVVAFLVIRAFLAEVFVIPSSSMVPTLLLGDRVVVLKPGGRDMPDRWDIVTFKRKGTTFVKRAVGLGGEEIALVGGDVYLGGVLAAKPASLSAALRAPYTSWRLDEPGGHESWPVSAGEEGWEVLGYKGSPLWSSAAPGTAPRAPRDVRLRDAHVEVTAERDEGSGVGVDLVYVLEGRKEPAAVYSLELTASGVRHVVKVGEETRFIQRQPGKAAGSLTLQLSYVDGVLRAQVGAATWEQALPAADRPLLGAYLVPQVRRRGGGARLRGLRLDKDLHYTRAGQLGVAPSSGEEGDLTYAYRIPDDAVFFLGDNTTNSNDSRFTTVGAIPCADLIGPMRFRIWPLHRLGIPD